MLPIVALADFGGTHHEAETLDNPRDISVPMELTAMRKSGTAFPAEVLISKMLDNGQIVFIAMIRDVSERHKHTQQLQLAGRVINVSS